MTTLEKIKKEISENQKVISETLSLDKENEFYNGKWAGFELALAIIDKYASEECDRDCEHCAYLECPKEPCEDAVSRQAVLKEFEKGTENLYGRIDKLPSVQPKAKTGHWIRLPKNGLSGLPWYECSECEKERCIAMLRDFNYCPNCGAEMKGGAE